MQGIFRKENTDKALKYGIYRHLPTYEKIIRNLVSFLYDKIILNTATKFGNISVRRFVLDIFANGINTLSMFTFIETDIFLFHVLLQVRLPHYQPTVLLTWKLLMALIQ